ncbi:hypothetical protein [Cupriavidus nantongensis]|uniref:hypothetical protein n=1 Tax=Cupriavidus nantongensis TaxID=1796606 RepID=UPI00123743D6|nr:hypothetical protein [Cupriavidus nantongensis]
MKTAIIVGANSMPGRRIAALLRAAGVAVVTAGRSSASEIGVDLRRGWIHGDLTARGFCLDRGHDAHVRLGLPAPMSMRAGIAGIRAAGTASLFGPPDVS